MALLFAVSYCIFYALCLRSSSDISIHATWAAEGDFRDLTSFFHHGAHPMWHVLVAIVLLLPGMPLPVAAALVTALCKAAEYAVVYWLFNSMLDQRFPRWQTALWALCCLLVSSLLIPFYNPTVYAGVGTANTWHSPTQLMVMVWMFLCVFQTARCYDSFLAEAQTRGERATLKWSMPLLLGFMLVCSLAAKPTFMQAFLPAACLFFLAMWIRHPRNSRFFLQMIVCVLPAVILMILQYMYYFGIIVPSQGDMVLELSLDKLKNALIATLLIQAFPLYALVLCRRAKKDTMFTLALMTDGVGLVEYIILGENGRRAADGNFGWGMMGAALLLWVTMLPRFLITVKEEREKAGKLRPAHIVGFVLLGWHLVSGLYYMGYLLTTVNPF